MDFSSELLKMIEARSHPRFVQLVVWAAGIGIIAAALLLVGQLGMAVARVSGETYAFLGAPAWPKAIALLKSILPGIIGSGIALGAVSFFERRFFAPKARFTLKRAQALAEYFAEQSANVQRGFALLDEEIQKANDSGVDVSALKMQVWEPIIRLQEEFRSSLGLPAPPAETPPNKERP